jgi:hypothetical protein
MKLEQDEDGSPGSVEAYRVSVFSWKGNQPITLAEAKWSFSGGGEGVTVGTV